MTRRQTRGCMLSQAVTLGIMGVAIGIPAGLILGGLTWFAVADPAGVATDVARPIGAVVLVVLSTTVVAACVAAVLSSTERHEPPASALRGST